MVMEGVGVVIEGNKAEVLHKLKGRAYFLKWRLAPWC